VKYYFIINWIYRELKNGKDWRKGVNKEEKYLIYKMLYLPGPFGPEKL